jgi:hypothetical protein
MVMKNNLRIFNSQPSKTRKDKSIKGLKLGVFISKLETFADIKQGRFRRIFNRHLKPYGF